MNEASAERIAEAAARIAMVDAEVLALLRQHFATAECVSMYLAPSLPAKAVTSARRTHAAHLPLAETILAVYDDTLFESGEDGFVITSRRLCWKNQGDVPRSIEWKDIDPDRLFADGRKLFLGRGTVLVSDESVVDAAGDAFHILALSARATASAAGVPGRSSRTEVMPSAPARPSARPTFKPAHPPTLQSAIAPAMPKGPVAKARGSAPPPAPESEAPPEGSVPARPAYSYVQYAVHASSEPAPGYRCWHCQASLHWNAPRCGGCGAWPTPQGWLRTA